MNYAVFHGFYNQSFVGTEPKIKEVNLIGLPLILFIKKFCLQGRLYNLKIQTTLA